MRLLQGFRDFILRGNVIDLAVGIVIGAAFTALVAAFTSSFIEPLLKLLGGGGSLAGSFFVNGVEFNWSTFVNAIITFLITAAALYFFVVMPVNKWAKGRKKSLEERTDLSDEVQLLKEIRDALRSGQDPTHR
jgi:large conductance mechanosensitive channel